MDQRLKDRLFACIFNDSDEAVVGLDSSGDIQTWSRGAAELLGLSKEEVLGKPISQLFPERSEGERVLEAAGGVSVLKNYEAEMRRDDGSREKFFLTVHSLGDPPEAYLVLVTPSVVDFDVTPEHKAIQQALVRMERFSTVGRMATAFAHEMRTPLHIISSTAEFGLQFLSPDDKLRANLDMILRNARYASLSIRALLDFAKAGKSQLREASLNQVVRTVLDLVERTCHKRGIDLEARLGDVPKLLIDEPHMRAVIHNLLVNAIEAMPGGGRLGVVTEPFEDGGVRLVVQDSGVGMSREVLAQIATPFFTTKDDGTGLGLYLAKRVLAEHGAAISFDSSPKSGTSVTVTFRPGSPAAPAP